MSKHVVIEFDPNAVYEWNRCAVRGLFSHGDVDLKELLAEAIQNKPGHYLAKVSVSVEVMEYHPLHESEVSEQEAAIAPFELAA